jgi:apolipoprotein N-acyltransferase
MIIFVKSWFAENCLVVLHCAFLVVIKLLLFRVAKLIMKQNLNKLQLILLSGVLLWASWYPHGFTFIIFIAFVPLFFLSEKLLEKKKGFVFGQGILASFPAFLIWNIGTTWWIWNSTQPGSVVAIVLNSLFMSCVFGAWHSIRMTILPKVVIPIAFIAFWCVWEYLHLNWQINWPWLNLGNVFAANPKIVQWYEYTGTFGGTIWILIVNFLVYSFFQQRYINYPVAISDDTSSKFEGDNKKSVKIFFNHRHLHANKTFITLTFTIITPIIISLIIYKTYEINHENGIETIIVQQNIDPWTEQYKKSNTELAELIIEIAVPKLTSNTELIICPESAIPHTIDVEQLYNLDIYPSALFLLFDELFLQYPRMNVVLGLSTVAFFESKISAATRVKINGDFVEYYNTSCLYNKNNLELYHKSRLVPGVERMPYIKIFGFLENLAVDLGGISGSLGVDVEQRVFSAITKYGTVKMGAPICYESIFGELFSEFVRNGAQIMCIITNDAWWGNTPGYKQHFEMSRLRAIETRRYVLRAANTGISAFIDPLGNAWQETDYETRTAIAQIVYPNNKITFYTKHGDYLAKIMIGICIILIIKSRLSRLSCLSLKNIDICTLKKNKCRN